MVRFAIASVCGEHLCHIGMVFCAEAERETRIEQLPCQLRPLAIAVDDDGPLLPGIGLGAEFGEDGMDTGHHIGPEPHTMDHHGEVHLTGRAESCEESLTLQRERGIAQAVKSAFPDSYQLRVRAEALGSGLEGEDIIAASEVPGVQLEAIGLTLIGRQLGISREPPLEPRNGEGEDAMGRAKDVGVNVLENLKFSN